MLGGDEQLGRLRLTDLSIWPKRTTGSKRAVRPELTIGPERAIDAERPIWPQGRSVVRKAARSQSPVGTEGSVGGEWSVRVGDDTGQADERVHERGGISGGRAGLGCWCTGSVPSKGGDGNGKQIDQKHGRLWSDDPGRVMHYVVGWKIKDCVVRSPTDEIIMNLGQ